MGCFLKRSKECYRYKQTESQGRWDSRAKKCPKGDNHIAELHLSGIVLTAFFVVLWALANYLAIWIPLCKSWRQSRRRSTNANSPAYWISKLINYLYFSFLLYLADRNVQPPTWTELSQLIGCCKQSSEMLLGEALFDLISGETCRDFYSSSQQRV